MKIIGWLRKGNVVRFHLGKDNLEYWSGDDWNDAPYEHNACTFPLFDIEETVDIAFGYDVSVMEPADDYHYNGNSPFSMNDFKDRKAPILAIDVLGEERWYSECVNREDIFAIFMGDRFEDINWKGIGGVIIDTSIDTVIRNSGRADKCSSAYHHATDEGCVELLERLKQSFTTKSTLSTSIMVEDKQ